MRKIFTLLTMCLLASSAWAVDIVFDATVDVGTGSSTAGEFTIVKDGITVHVEQGVANGTHYRFYKGKKVTITSEIGAMTKIVFDCVGAGNDQYGSGGFTSEPGDYVPDEKLGIWTNAGASQVVFTATNFQVRATKITVTVGGEVGQWTPRITPASGVYYEPVQVSMRCYIPGAKIYYTTDGSDPTTSSTLYTGPFVLNSNTIVKAISELDGVESDVVSAEYIIIDGVYLVDNNLYITSSVTSVKGLQVNPSAIYSFAAVPPECDENTFLGYGATLHMPSASYGAYFTADYWCNFAYMYNDAVAPTGVTISNTSVELIRGNTCGLSATVSPNNASLRTVQWSSTDVSIATVNNSGMVTAMAAGECDIVVTCLDKQAVCHVAVLDPISVTLDQTEVTIEQTQQVTLTATIYPEGSAGQSVSWSTTDSSVATVNNGVVTGVGIGECDIIASYLDKQAVCHVTVVPATIYITLDKHEAKLLPNHALTITPSMTPLSTDLKVSSSNPEVAAARLMNGVVQVVGLAEGTTRIVVSSVDGQAVPDTCLVTVYTENGDVNCDGFVNIADVTDLIDYLLSGNDDSVSQTNTDCDKDGSVNIADVTALIDYLLMGHWPWDAPVYEAFTVNGVTFKMVAVEGGTFTMGATAEQGSDALAIEKPAHQVTLSSYSIGETEVTQALWVAVMGSNPSYFSPRNSYTENLQRPVEYVSWNDCQTFISRLNELTGKTFRLPTEAEWEYAARGGNRSQGYKYAGSNDINTVAWYWFNIPSQSSGTEGYGTQAVATKAPNELGLYDMSGNVWEWCQDWYGSYSSESQTNPTGPTSGSYRVFRGGGWTNDAEYCRVSDRPCNYPTCTFEFLGLRLAL